MSDNLTMTDTTTDTTDTTKYEEILDKLGRLEEEIKKSANVSHQNYNSAVIAMNTGIATLYDMTERIERGIEKVAQTKTYIDKALMQLNHARRFQLSQ